MPARRPDRRLLLARSRVALAGLLGLVAACATPSRKEERTPLPDPLRAAAPALAWTSAFDRPVVLFADTIAIEGPPGTLEHVATRIDPLAHGSAVRATEQGLLQTYVLKPGVQPLEIAAFVDRLEAYAFTRLSVLERPGADAVEIVASGDVLVRDGTTQVEERKSAHRIRAPLDVAAPPR